MPANGTKLSGKQVLVTGGTGFLGSRLVEKLVLEEQAIVRVLVRDCSRASRIARFPVQIVRGSILECSSVRDAAMGCEIVFHLAYGNSGDEELQRRTTVDGTENVLAAALKARVNRFVHLGTVMTYGTTFEGDLDETSPRRGGGVYPDSKLEAEKAAVHYMEKYGLPVAILQPTTVYGPFSPFWTVAILEAMKNGTVMLVNGGEGLCNPVYLDDAVEAMILAATRKEAVGEAFLISDGQPVLWKQFYGRYEQMLGKSATVSLSEKEAIELYRSKTRRKYLLQAICALLREETRFRDQILRTRELALLIKTVKVLLPEAVWSLAKNLVTGPDHTGREPAIVHRIRPIMPISPALVRFCATKPRVRIDKARRLLGFEPAFDFETGMLLTEKWAAWAHIL